MLDIQKLDNAIHEINYCILQWIAQYVLSAVIHWIMVYLVVIALLMPDVFRRIKTTAIGNDLPYRCPHPLKITSVFVP